MEEQFLPDEIYARKERRKLILKFFDDMLTDKEKFVFKKRFYEDYTLQEVSNELGISKERVRQIEGIFLRRWRGNSLMSFSSTAARKFFMELNF